MREIQEFPLLTAKKRRTLIVTGFVLCLAGCIIWSGCGIKRTVKIPVSPKILAARNASLEELLGIIGKYDKIKDMKASGLKVFLTSGKLESGKQDEFKGASGYILLRRPDALHLVLQSPFIDKTAIFDVVSLGDDFSAWIRKNNRIYTGKNSAQVLVADDLPNGIPLRPPHLFEAILPASIHLDREGIRVSVEESADKFAKYYILSVYREGIPPRIHTIRRIWIERSQLVLFRQQMFEEDGRLICDVEYPVMEQIGEFYLPLRIILDRPEDGYSLEMEFKNSSWKINTGLEDSAFVQTPRPGAETVYFRDHK